MKIKDIRKLLADYKESYIWNYKNRELLINNSISSNSHLIKKLLDDIELLPHIDKTRDGTEPKFYLYDYKEI